VVILVALCLGLDHLFPDDLQMADVILLTAARGHFRLCEAVWF
jgi:hypothetical protein